MSPREQKRTWNANLRAYRRTHRLCQRCGEKLPPAEARLSCSACLSVKSLKRGSGIRAQAGERLKARLTFIAKTYRDHSLSWQAQELGVKPQTVRWMRWEARRRGFITGPHGNTTNQESRKWRSLETSGACSRCGLRGPHECVPSIYEFAAARRGPGRVMPEGGPSGMRVGTKR